MFTNIALGIYAQFTSSATRKALIVLDRIVSSSKPQCAANHSQFPHAMDSISLQKDAYSVTRRTKTETARPDICVPFLHVIL
jgi:hypothetical protein